MNRKETAQLLAMVQAFDRRTVGEADVVAWHTTLADVAFGDAAQAVTAWFRDRTDWLMPADVRKAVKRAKSLALNAAPEAVPDADPDDVPAYLAALRAGRAKQLGELDHRPVRALTQSTFKDVR